jgi:DNA-binding phage protein
MPKARLPAGNPEFAIKLKVFAAPGLRLVAGFTAD